MNGNLLFFLFTLFVVYAGVVMILAYLARVGWGILLFLTLLWFWYRQHHRLLPQLKRLHPLAWWRGRRKERTYRQLKQVWARILERHHPEMICPGCKNEISIFTINLKGRCTICQQRLL